MHNSGSLITARLAAEQGRDVFAVPGSITSFKSMGTHGLIKEGAKLVEHAADIIEELNPAIRHSDPVDVSMPTVDVDPMEKQVLDQLTAYPVHIDHLVRQLSLPAGELSGVLLHLELKGLVIQTPGNRFARNDHMVERTSLE
ncbi:MAG: DNA-protecting protein DprA, partial [Deltaproteobacteria bacterium]|nr:DNA-protecting protein DprA [Deltaproteobacteria bacterium]